jgi:hypothetical protein
MKSIIILIHYFGKWPEWFPLYLESCRHNPTIDWLFYTDCPFDSFQVKNVAFRYISREDFVKRVRERLGVDFSLEGNYKLCDLKPMMGALCEEEIRGYDFYGYGDIDVIYGDIRKFYTDEVLQNNVLSTHTWCISGHLALFRNKRWVRQAFRRHKDWRRVLEDPAHQRFDEDMYTAVFGYPALRRRIDLFLYELMHPFSIKYRRKLYFREQYTTPLMPGEWRNGTFNHPNVWFWKNGCITNELDGDTPYIYFHFMNYKNARYMNPAWGKEAYWSRLSHIVHVRPEEMANGIRIDRFGFHPLKWPHQD